MSVHRTNPLPTGVNRGRLIVPLEIAGVTQRALQSFSGTDGAHEGLVYWAGRRCGDDTLVLSAIAPPSDHGPQHVFVAAEHVGPMARRARAAGLAIVAQVHSHPGDDTRHSDGDDTLILMPSEGMFSLVVARYGRGGIHPTEGAGLHQYQDRRWVHIPAAHADALLLVPPYLG
jgi:proteasome lid subunit RPN8/RPN11